jgi:hypothetical protein
VSAQFVSDTVAFVIVDGGSGNDCTAGVSPGGGGPGGLVGGGGGGGGGGGIVASVVSVCDPCVSFLIQGAPP